MYENNKNMIFDFIDVTLYVCTWLMKKKTLDVRQCTQSTLTATGMMMVKLHPSPPPSATTTTYLPYTFQCQTVWGISTFPFQIYVSNACGCDATVDGSPSVRHKFREPYQGDRLRNNRRCADRQNGALWILCWQPHKCKFLYNSMKKWVNIILFLFLSDKYKLPSSPSLPFLPLYTPRISAMPPWTTYMTVISSSNLMANPIPV